MKKKFKLISLLALSLSLFALASCGQGAKGPTGDKGPNGQNGQNGLNGEDGKDGNTLLNGTTDPSNEIGNNGDLYLNTSTGDVFKKDGTSWILLTNIYGEDGKDGLDGNNGSTGNDGSTAWSNTILPSYGGQIIPSKGSALVNQEIIFTIIPEGENTLYQLFVDNEEVSLTDSKLTHDQTTNVYKYTVKMKTNGFVLRAVFKGKDGNIVYPESDSSGESGNQTFEVSSYNWNEEFNLEKNQSPYYLFTNDDLNEYYKNVDFNASGEDLISSLYDTIKDHNSINYDGNNIGWGFSTSSKGAAYLLSDRNFDESPLTQNEVDTNRWNLTDLKMNVMYITESCDLSQNSGMFSTYNREHIWAKSRGFNDGENNTQAGHDMHHLRLADPGTNSSHGNQYYGEPSGGGYWCPPTEEDKGDIARAIFYMATRYSKYEEGNPWLELAERPTYPSGSCSSSETKDKAAEMGRLSTLLKWHEEDPVDNFELTRNNLVYSLQKNRNPFIDCPSLAEQIWG